MSIARGELQEVGDLDHLDHVHVDHAVDADQAEAELAGPHRPPVYFLVSSAAATGGLARTVLNLANHLSADTTVEIISIFRSKDETFYDIDSRVKVTYLIDLSHGVVPLVAPFLRPFAERLAALPSLLAPAGGLKDKRMSRLSDLAMWWYLRSLPEGVLVTTHPSLHVASVRFARPEIVKVGQEHMSYLGRNDPIKKLLQEYAGRLDAIAILTQADLETFRGITRGTPTVVTAIPNALPWGTVEQGAPLTSKTVVGAGALLPRKAFKRLIEAFAPVAEKHPDWRLHIYGSGRMRRALQNTIRELGLVKQVELKGRTNRMQDVLMDASIMGLTSVHEGFPMVLPEAMSKGVPVVSFDCPTGPAEIVDNGVNGFLVPDRDVAAFTQALMTLVEDDSLRMRMGAAALRSGRAYDINAIGERWKQLFEELSVRKAQTARARRRRR